jgi:hypothetical protein
MSICEVVEEEEEQVSNKKCQVTPAKETRLPVKAFKTKPLHTSITPVKQRGRSGKTVDRQ